LALRINFGGGGACVATTIIINSGKAKYSWVTVLPLSFVATTTLVAGWESITDIFCPWHKTRNVGAGLQSTPAHRHYHGGGPLLFWLIRFAVGLALANVRK